MQVQDAVEKEWQDFREERSVGVVEINELRQRVAEEDSRLKAETKDELDQDVGLAASESNGAAENKIASKQDDDAKMEIDEAPSKEESKEEPPSKTNPEPEHKEDPLSAMHADEDDAVEY